MNKIAFCFVGIVILVMCGVLNVYAEETTDDEEIGMNTEQTYTYSISYATVELVMSNPQGYARGSMGDGTITFNGDRVCAFWDGNEVFFIVFRDKAVITQTPFVSNLVDYNAIVNGKSRIGMYELSSGDWCYTSSNIPVVDYNDLQGHMIWKNASSFDDANIKTTIPIFSSYDEALQFINGDIGEDSSLNFDDVVEYVYDSDEVPIPRNLEVYQENGKYFIQWEQTVEDIEHIQLARVGKTVLGMEYERIDGKVYPGRPHFDDIDYEPSLIQKIDLTDVILEIKSYFKKCEVDEYKMVLDIDVKNRWNKSITEVHYSRLVHAILTISYTYEDGLKIEVGYEETDKDGNYVPDSDYNDVYDNSELINDNFTIGGGSSGVSGSNFISNIVNGFGLLGDNGLLGFLKSAISCLPSFVWELIGTGLSILILVAIFKAVIC